MRRPISILIGMLLSGIGHAQSLSPGLGALVDSLARFNVWHNRAVGESGRITEQWRRYEQLSAKASLSDLDLLIQHRSAVVRCYAFLALAERPDVDLLPRLLPHINDTTQVDYFVGCSRGKMPTPCFMMEMAHSNWISNRARHLSEVDRARLLLWLMMDLRGSGRPFTSKHHRL